MNLNCVIQYSVRVGAFINNYLVDGTKATIITIRVHITIVIVSSAWGLGCRLLYYHIWAQTRILNGTHLFTAFLQVSAL